MQPHHEQVAVDEHRKSRLQKDGVVGEGLGFGYLVGAWPAGRVLANGDGGLRPWRLERESFATSWLFVVLSLSVWRTTQGF